MLTAFTALAVFGSCNAARWYLGQYPARSPSGRRDSELWSGRVRLRETWNDGAAFSLPLPKDFLTPASAAALGALWACRKQSPLAAGLVLGGGLSNLCERIQHGRVFDYVQFPKAPGQLKRYVFNLADFAILSGGAWMLFHNKKH